MNYSPHYTTPPPGYMPFDYVRTPPVSPAPGTHGYYSPRYSAHTATPSPRASPKVHTRRASQADPHYAHHRVPPQYYGYASPRHYASPQPPPPQRAPADYVPIYTEADPKPRDPRPRRASHSSSRSHHATPKRPAPAARPSPPKATEDDARRAGIPAGYSYKNWDPSEEPIMLLGSVFDANSLGKWIFDWTVFHYGPATPIADLAGDLWLLLIQLAGKVKRAEECMSKIRRQENRELVDDFLESGERLWVRFAKLLKVCEEYMWKAAKKDNGDKKPLNMGKNSGCEFVDTLFGRDRELDKTEKLMTGMRLWGMRFDANCDDILRRPSV